MEESLNATAVWLDIEEFEHGLSELMLVEHGFPVWGVHYGCYRLWNPDDLHPSEMMHAATRFLTERFEDLLAIRSHLKNPMRLCLRMASCPDEMPAELREVTDRLGITVDVIPMRST